MIFIPDNLAHDQPLIYSRCIIVFSPAEQDVHKNLLQNSKSLWKTCYSIEYK